MSDYSESLKKLPLSWKICRYKDIYHSIKEVAGDKANDYDRLALTMGGVIKRSKEDDKGLQPADFKSYQILRKDDMVFKMIDLQNISTSRVGRTQWEGLVSPAYLRFEPKYEDPGFMYYYFMSLYYRNVFNNIAGDGVRSALNSTDIGNIICPYPPLNEQQSIVETLDRKISQIDKLIANQEKQIEKLNEYKQSVITKAVTKGLDPNVRMKDSGVEWIEYIPEECSIVKIKKVCSENITDGTHATPEYTSEELGFPFLSSKDVRNGIIDWSDIKYITYETHENIQRGITPKRGDVLLSKNGSIGFSAVVDTDRKFDIYVTLALLRPNSLILSKYLKYALDSLTTQNQFNLHLIGIGVPNLHLNVIQDTKIILHPIKEQEKIVEYLDAKCKKIDEFIKIKQQKIEKLQEYKKSLIYEYVTGKKQVA